MSSLEKCLFRSSAHFLTGLFFYVNLYEFLTYFGYYSRIRCLICEYLPSFNRLFVLLCKTFSSDVVSRGFSFVSLAWGEIHKRILLRVTLKSLLPVFCSRSFMVSGLTFKSLIHFEFIFVYGKKVVQLHFLKIYLLIWKRQKHWFVVPLIYASISWPLYVPYWGWNPQPWPIRMTL